MRMLKLIVLFLILNVVYWTHASGNTVTVSTFEYSGSDMNFKLKREFSKPTCNTLFCVSVVSFCNLQQKCICNPALNCSCCKACAICLGEFYEHCCDCVGMCEKNISAVLPTLASTVDFLQDPNADLFRALTDEPIPQLKYKIVRFPIVEELSIHHRRKKEGKVSVEHVAGKGWTYDGLLATEYWANIQLELKQSTSFDKSMLCTVAYFDKCVSLKDCYMSCDSMGAPSFRWFHNGCCQCVGPTCLNYGNAYPKCRDCMS